MNESFVQPFIHFLREAYAELRKVTWLSRKEAIASTIVILILVAIMAMFVSMTDLVLSRILSIIL